MKRALYLTRILSALALLPLSSVCPATAQIIGTLHTFSGGNDGAVPFAGLVFSGDTLYGTAGYGGSPGNGTIFAVHTDSAGFTNLYGFTAGSGTNPNITNSDGANPFAGLILSGNTLYGTADSGGTNGNGTIFAINTNGTGFMVRHTFAAGGLNSLNIPTNGDGADPNAGVILSGNTLYGTAWSGGTNGNGTIFAVNTNGTGFMVLHTFTANGYNSLFIPTNSDGANPYGVILSGNILFGVADAGGTNGNGTIFAINTNGTGFTVLHTFTAGSGNFPNITNNDGAYPNGLILSGNTLYGTAFSGGTNGNGTIFAVNTNGTGFANFYSFTAGAGINSKVINNDGAEPDAGMILSGNTLYGTAEYGGNSGAGTVFAINTNGAGFTTLYSFTGGSDGASPNDVVVLSGNTLYGTAAFGSYSDNGTVFSLSLGLVRAPPINIIPAGTNVILSWPTNATGFTLQSVTNMVPPTVWSNVSTAPVVINGNYYVTNSLPGPRKFFRLLSPSAPFGIYMGSFAGQLDNGGFATMVLPNGQGVVVVGYDTPQNAGVLGANFFVPVTGGFTDDTIQGGTASGIFTTNTVSGNYLDYSNNDIGTFSGMRKPDTGIQQANAGYYTGSFSGAASGSAYAVLAADGTGFFYTLQSPTNDAGGFGTIDISNNVSATTVPNGVTITGTLNPTNHVISGSYSLSGTTLGTFSVSLTTSQ